jgi:polysaccharide export outer membrane protein
LALSALILAVAVSESSADSSVRVVADDEGQSAAAPVDASTTQGAIQASASSPVKSTVGSPDMAPASSLVELYDYGNSAESHKVTPLEWRNLGHPGSALATPPADGRPGSKRILVTAVPETPDVFTLHFNNVESNSVERPSREPAPSAPAVDPNSQPTIALSEPGKQGAIPKLIDLFKSRMGSGEMDEAAAVASVQPNITPIAPEVTFAAKSSPATTPVQPVVKHEIGPAVDAHFAHAISATASDMAAEPSLVQTDVSVLAGEPSASDLEIPPTPLLHEAYAGMAVPKFASTRMEPRVEHSFEVERTLEHGPIGDPMQCGPDTSRFLYGCPYYPTQSGAHTICGVDCGPHCASCNATWKDARCIPWSMFGPGEYVGPARTVHVSAYHLRVNDLLTLTYIASRQRSADRYRIGVGDRLRIESGTDETLDREVEVQPDGEITLPIVGDVTAAGKTVKDFREELVQRYRRVEREPIITVTPVIVNVGLQEILRAVTSQSRSAGQALDLRVTPEGTIQAPGIGSVFVQGLTLEELRTELEARYEAEFGPGLLISPALTERATSYVFVGGEVKSPGRYTLEGPTTVMQAIALAGGWNNGGELRQVVVFRRDENWCLKATKINVHKPLYGKDPCPVNDVWLRDNDLVIVPKSVILCATDVVELYFTRGIYAVFPISYVYDFSSGSNVVPVGP